MRFALWLIDWWWRSARISDHEVCNLLGLTLPEPEEHGPLTPARGPRASGRGPS